MYIVYCHTCTCVKMQTRTLYKHKYKRHYKLIISNQYLSTFLFYFFINSTLVIKLCFDWSCRFPFLFYRLWFATQTVIRCLSVVSFFSSRLKNSRWTFSPDWVTVTWIRCFTYRKIRLLADNRLRWSSKGISCLKPWLKSNAQVWRVIICYCLYQRLNGYHGHHFPNFFTDFFLIKIK